MITRLVKMKFRADETENFQQIFVESRNAIASMPGCNSVELKRDVNDPTIFFTISKWESVEDLDRYRASELFGKVWGKTKILFDARPEAWSLGE